MRTRLSRRFNDCGVARRRRRPRPRLRLQDQVRVRCVLRADPELRARRHEYPRSRRLPARSRGESVLRNPHRL